MAATISISLSMPTQARRDQEREIMKYLLSRVEQAIGDGTSLSGTVLDRSGASGGTWTFRRERAREQLRSKHDAT
jgi:hypothetical protein